ncbi:MAG TPA: glycosyltransferase family 39 protein [Sedimentisphaerales bacterium]|nr:glycosyltransferase family 39 protein [Sedimentisphaerales bacterium]
MPGRKGYIFVLVVLQAILGLACLNVVPRIYVDEAWDSALGYNLAHTGSLKHPFIEGFGGMNVHLVQNRLVLPLVCAAIYKVAGYSVLTSRLASLIFGLLAVVSLYAVMRRWFGEKQALWIGLATVINPWFFEVSRRVRPEIYYTALGLVFLWLIVLYLDSVSRRTAFFIGVLAGLSALTHPTGLVIVFSISLAVVIWCRIRSIGRVILWAGIGFCVVILPYVIYVLWAVQDPQVSFIEQVAASMVPKPFLHSEIVRWRAFLRWPKGAPLAVVMFVSWIAAWYRSSTADKIIATIIVLFAFLMPFTTVSATSRYVVAIVPFFSALIVRLIWRVITGSSVILQNWHKTRLAVGMCALIVYLSTCISGIAVLFYFFWGADVYKVINRVASVVEPDSRVYGDPMLWFGNDKYKYGPWLYISENRPITLGEAVDWASKHRFDYVVRTAWKTTAPQGIVRPPRLMPDFHVGNLRDHLCHRYGKKVDEFYDPYYGPIEIYRLDWDRPFPYHKQFNR